MICPYCESDLLVIADISVSVPTTSEFTDITKEKLSDKRVTIFSVYKKYHMCPNDECTSRVNQQTN